METLVYIIVIVAVIAYLVSEKNKKIQILKAEYEKALKGKNKGVALKAGRAYYQAMRSRYGLRRMAFGSSLTTADEVSIMNEINALMK